MPLVNLIFFPEPVERTEAQIEEARALGHIREPDADGAGAGAEAGEPGGSTDTDTNSEAGDTGHDTEETA